MAWKPPNLLPVADEGLPVAVCVTGSRDWTDAQAIHRDLARVEYSGRLFTVIEGDAKGADRIAGRGWAAAARKRGIGWVSVPADWKRHGKAAGPIRNRLMLDWLLQCRDIGVLPVVLAYPLAGSVGTWDMITTARAAGVRVFVRHNPLPSTTHSGMITT